MADLFLLSQAQMRRIERYFPLSHGVAQGPQSRAGDDRRHASQGASHRREPFKKPVAGRGPACGGRNGVAILIAGGERPRNFWWLVTPSKNVAHGLLRT